VENLEPLTMDEQVALSEGINNLPDYLLPGAMQIIREADTVNDDDDEIDLDLDMLDITTQRKLQRYINEVRLCGECMAYILMHGIYSLFIRVVLLTAFLCGMCIALQAQKEEKG
jgi:hypothetical protein